jgi:hypothetical protein
MKKAIAKKEKKEIAEPVSEFAIPMDEEGISTNDILIPKITLMQAMSQLVAEGEASVGEFRDTVDHEKFGDYKTPFEIIPFYITRKWVEYDVSTTKKGIDLSFRAIVPIITNPASPKYNDSLPYTSDDGLISRVRVQDLYCILPDEVELGTAFPYVIPFQKTSAKAGKKAYTQMYIRNGEKGASYCTLDVSAKATTNDKGTFGVLDVKAKRKSTEAELKEAYKWYKIVSSGRTKVDESDIDVVEKVLEDTGEF